MTYKVVFRPRAAEVLTELYSYVLDRTGLPDTAIGYIRRIRVQCDLLAEMPEREPLRPEVGKDVRILPLEHRAVIAYRVARMEAEILGIFHGGRFLEPVLDEE